VISTAAFGTEAVLALVQLLLLLLLLLCLLCLLLPLLCLLLTTAIEGADSRDYCQCTPGTAACNACR
jgi:hypothetical protein